MTVHVTSIQLSLLLGGKRPPHAGVQKCVKAVSCIDLDLCMFGQFIVGSYSLDMVAAALLTRWFSSKLKESV